MTDNNKIRVRARVIAVIFLTFLAVLLIISIFTSVRTRQLNDCLIEMVQLRSQCDNATAQIKLYRLSLRLDSLENESLFVENDSVRNLIFLHIYKLRGVMNTMTRLIDDGSADPRQSVLVAQASQTLINDLSTVLGQQWLSDHPMQTLSQHSVPVLADMSVVSELSHLNNLSVSSAELTYPKTKEDIWTWLGIDSNGEAMSTTAEWKKAQQELLPPSGPRLLATNLSLKALNSMGRPDSDISNAVQFVLTLTIDGDDNLQYGEKTLYMRLLSPSGDLVALGGNVPETGSSYTAKKIVKFEGNSINGVRMFCDVNKPLPRGTYTAEIFSSGKRIASARFHY